MINNYIIPIKTAFSIAPIIILLLMGPFSVYQYKKYGYINRLKTIVLISFVFYIVSAFCLVILPLPSYNYIPKEAIKPQLVPFTALMDIGKEFNIMIDKNFSIVQAIFKNKAILQIIFNLMLMAPLGFFITYYFKRELKTIIIITFIVSLFFEVTQLTGNFGMYNFAYRLFDVDDLIINTLGGIVGYCTVPLANKIFPEISNEKREFCKIL